MYMPTVYKYTTHQSLSANLCFINKFIIEVYELYILINCRWKVIGQNECIAVEAKLSGFIINYLN